MTEARDTQTLVAPREAEPPFVLALDVGTSSARAAVYDRFARKVAGTRARADGFFQTTSDGGAEADAEASLALVARVLDEATERAGQQILSHVRAVATACFWHSLVGVDASGRAVTPLLGWADTRAAAQAEDLRRQLDDRAWHARTGCRFHSSYWPAKLLWLHEAGARRGSVHRWLSFGDMLASRFGGAASRVPVTSVSMASGTGLFDQHACAWDAELVAQLHALAPGLELNLEQLPRVEEASAGAAFMLGGEYAARWPALRRDVPWFGAVGDGACNNVGAGCATREHIGVMLGTSGAARVVYEGGPHETLDPGLWCYRLDGRRVITGGALSDGGNLRAWMRDTLKLDQAHYDSTRTTGAEADEGVDERTERSLASVSADAHGLTVLPFWSGERSTGWHAGARGAILGLGAHTTAADILRASAEAVAYRLARVVELLAPHAPAARVRASGGALVKSPAWAQILTDVLGREVELVDAPEATSRGAALLALEALGAIKDIADAPVPPFRVYAPDAARHAAYRRAAARQQHFYETLVAQPANTKDDTNT